MRVVGVPSPVGSPTVEFTISHGEHPVDALYHRGHVPLQPLRVSLEDGQVVFTYLVRDRHPGERTPRRRRSHTFDKPHPGEDPVPRQRIGAYAVVTSELGVLGTVNSDRTPAPGTWALPGGGVDPDESPAEAVIREVYEESGQAIQIQQVLTLESEHWIGRAPSGVLEDFHALRIVYSAKCEAPSSPVVHDLGGSTERASWVSWRSWRSLRWTMSSRELLARYAGQLSEDQSLK